MFMPEVVQTVVALEYQGVRYFAGNFGEALAFVLQDLAAAVADEGLQPAGRAKCYIRYTANYDYATNQHRYDTYLCAEISCE
jgi:hypothetical protein